MTMSGGKARKKRDADGEKGDKARKDKGMWPRKRPDDWKGPWPPRPPKPPNPPKPKVKAGEFPDNGA
jgi:hypothetical protein